MKGARPVGAVPLGRIVAGMVLALVAVLAVAGPAVAHDTLVGTDPAQGATLAGAPAAVRLTFAETILEHAAQVQVSGPGGVVSTGAVTINGPMVAAALRPDLPGGSYTVLWRVTSTDGHPVSGTFTFTVTGPTGASASPQPTALLAAPAAPPASATPPSPSSPSSLPIVAGVLVTVVLAGAVWFWLSRPRSGH